ncbi:hypothetical protein ACIPJ2_16035 [Curtobacterium sp. NPDC090217]|uniref:hypothetical protein n=1 Tax=Curtobacterium sp. NPDC090217 TaxID=3363970 RepID=UPI00382C1766
MALDGVPWFIGGQAEHGGDVARQLAYLACGGSEGVTAPGDLKVVPLDQAGPGVKVLAGSASILNRVSPQQAYTVRNPTADPDSVKIAGTGSTGGRADLVVCLVDNPNIDSNAQTPADLGKGPYDRFDIIAGVPAGTRRLQDLDAYKGTSGYALARIDQPANNAVITSAMITDLRKLTRARETTIPISDLGVSTATLSATAGTVFPPFQPTVEVPDWATYVRVELSIAGLSALGNSTGFYNVQLQNASGGNVIAGNTIAYNADAVVTSTRMPLLGLAEGDVTALRGQTLRPTVVMRKSAAAQANLKYDASSQLLFRVTFYERIS